jgi:hypothetical protein
MLDKTDVETIIRDRILSAEHSLEAIEGTLDDLKSALFISGEKGAGKFRL